MRFATLGSGSRGNATLVEAGATRLLVDCGLGLADIGQRLGALGVEAESLDAILVTHEHGDHVGGVGPLARRLRLPVLMSAGTWLAAAPQLGELPGLRLVSSHEPFALGDIEVDPLPVPHDAREPTQFVLGDGERRLGLLTDTGAVTPFLRERLDGCHALLLEFNHDEAMLREGPYPASLKNRILGRLGHLSNAQAAELLGTLDTSRLRHLVAAHLSEKNNSPEAARAAAAGALGCSPDWIVVAGQDSPGPWLALG